ncbi:MAG: DNA recombination protein RmuC [endosymbiont of Galathealinum brachiosum]|uniref:DNA recombination protein RmuC n=1 Tax=endosymbiont of Galathealinum brachiosum TaxID=2200906 RepID=A0A370DBW6_9GAMM|nr:MAG: DNA recombination protein RmuC [endosymbiont of Galathealinum brachiosum]
MDTKLIVAGLTVLLLLIVLLWWLASQLRLAKAQFQQLIIEKTSEAQQLQLVQISEMQAKLLESTNDLQNKQERRISELSGELSTKLNNSNELLQQGLNKHRESFDARQLDSLKVQQENLTQGMGEVRKQVTEALVNNGNELGKKVDALTRSTDERLKEISGQVDKRLNEGFEKTTATFTDVVKRLAQIDEAQKKITELSGNVVSLQEVLADKRSRGAFGEVQLNSLVRNVMPENSFAFQHTLSNNTRVDCMLFLPEPSGSIGIDSKFPLESFRKMTDIECSEADRTLAEKQFKKDIKKHINDIAGKYIISGETSDGAVMFIPAEAVFAEIHAHHYELVEEAQRARVWLVSPTTLMAVLTTARAVLKDSATRKQVHLIQDHLVALSKDFSRFQTRMDNLSKHIEQANKDVSDVNTSARKISSRFEKIEKVELMDENSEQMLTHHSQNTTEEKT